MDEDLAVGLLFIGLFLTFPILVVLSIPTCIAYSRTRTWKREQIRLQSSDNEPLVTAEEEDDFLDTDDEEEHKKLKAEELADRTLTTRQKFRKEFGKAWKGNGVNVMKQREREERRKLAKAVAREIERRERRRERESRQAGSSTDGDLLPRYEATAGDRKQ